jgi:hypothetical protein
LTHKAEEFGDFETLIGKNIGEAVPHFKILCRNTPRDIEENTEKVRLSGLQGKITLRLRGKCMERKRRK